MDLVHYSKFELHSYVVTCLSVSEMKPNYDAPLLDFAFVKFHVELKIELPDFHFTRPIEGSN